MNLPGLRITDVPRRLGQECWAKNVANITFYTFLMDHNQCEISRIKKETEKCCLYLFLRHNGTTIVPSNLYFYCISLTKDCLN